MFGNKGTYLKPRKSLRRQMTFWFFAFAILPVVFVTAYSLNEFTVVVNEELEERLKNESKELSISFSRIKNYLSKTVSVISEDLLFTEENLNEVSEVIKNQLKEYLMQSDLKSLSIYHKEKGWVLGFLKKGTQIVEIQDSAVVLSEAFISQATQEVGVFTANVNNDSYLELLFYRTFGEATEYIIGAEYWVGQSFLTQLKESINLDILFINLKNRKGFSTHSSFIEISKPILPTKKELKTGLYQSFEWDSDRYGVYAMPVLEKTHSVAYALIGSQKDYTFVINRIQETLIQVVFAVIIFTLISLVFISSSLLRPLKQLLQGVRAIERGEYGKTVDSHDVTELGYLTHRFNEMSKQLQTARENLNLKIEELEKANQLLKTAQDQLVQSEKMSSLGQLVAGVAHEINNPIGFIYANVSHLREYSDALLSVANSQYENQEEFEKKKSEKDIEYISKDLPKLLDSCEDGIQRVKEIVTGLSNFSRRDDRDDKEVDLIRCINNSLKLLSGEIRNRIQVHKDLDALSIMGRPSQINQVIMNLLNNSIQAIEDRGDIWISLKNVDDFVELRIKDNGVGIPKKDLKQIFDPFFTTKPVGKGTGLGLSISYGIIESHNGQISVESKENVGTEFILKFPC